MVTALLMGMAAPLVYFGVQIIAARFYPGYSFLRNTASQLGSDSSTFPAILNVGAILTGIAILFASIAFFLMLLRLGTAPIFVWLTALVMISFGVLGIRAGLFPLPDPRHSPGLLGFSAFLIPPLFAAVIWKRDDAKAVKVYLIVNVILLVALIPVMSGMAGLNTQPYQGLLQRIAAMIVYLPIGVVACYLLRKFRPGSPSA
jgi:hypothetical membrane protein